MAKVSLLKKLTKSKAVRRFTAAVTAAAIFVCAAATVSAENADNADKLFTREGDVCIYISDSMFLYNYKGDNPGLTICGYAGKSDSLVFPSTINGREVTAIGKNCFVNNNDITSVTMSGNIKEIGKNCFNGCQNLKTVTLRGNVNEFRDVFCDCPSLESIVFPQGVGSIIGSFKNCTALSYVRFSRSVSSIEEDSFNGCTALQKIEWLGGIIKLGNAFDNCTALESVEIPKGVIQIDGAFDGCTSLSEIILPETLLYITGGFSGCTSLTEVALPGKLLFVNESFNDCKNLSRLRFNETTSISDTAFTGCPKLVMERESNTLRKVLGWLVIAAVAISAGLLTYRILDRKAKEIERLKAKDKQLKRAEE